MKKSTFIIAFCCSTFLSIAQNNESPTTTNLEVSANEDTPNLITSVNGINVYYSSTTDQSGNTFLNIQFMNTTEETSTFNWEISRAGQIFKSQKTISIKPGKSFDLNTVLEVKGTTNLSDYAITLTTK